MHIAQLDDMPSLDDGRYRLHTACMSGSATSADAFFRSEQRMVQLEPVIAPDRIPAVLHVSTYSFVDQE